MITNPSSPPRENANNDHNSTLGGFFSLLDRQVPTSYLYKRLLLPNMLRSSLRRLSRDITDHQRRGLVTTQRRSWVGYAIPCSDQTTATDRRRRRRRSGTGGLRGHVGRYGRIHVSYPLSFFPSESCRQKSTRWFHTTLPLPQSSHDEESTTSTTTPSADIAALLERSQSFSSTPTTTTTDVDDTQQLQRLLADWIDVLEDSRRRRNEDEDAVHHPREVRATVNVLYDSWCATHGFPPSTGSSSETPLSESQAPLLPLWLEVYARLGVGPTALEILQGWTVCFGSHLELQPARKHYHTLLRSYTVKHDDGSYPEAPEVAYETLQLLEEFSFTMKPVTETYLWALQCAATNTTEADADVLERILQRAEPVVFARRSSSQPEVIPMSLWLETLHAVLDVAADGDPQQRGHHRIDEATLTPWLSIYADLLSSHDALTWLESDPSRAVPELRRAVQNVLALHANRRDRQTSADEMQRVLKATELLQEHVPPFELLRPADYLAVIQAFQSLLTACDMTIVEDLLHRLKKRHERRRADMTDDEAKDSFHALMQGFLAVGGYREVVRVHQLMVRERVPWNGRHFTIVLEAAAESRIGQMADTAVRLMKRTFRANRRYVRLETRHFTYIFHALLESAHREGGILGSEVFEWLLEAAKEAKSDVSVEAEHYASLAMLLGRSSMSNVPEKIMNMMESMREDHGLEPNDDMYTALVTALGRKSSIKAAKQAQKVWNDLSSRGNVNVRVYVAVMYAWMNSGDKDAIVYVEETFERLMSDANFYADLKPNKAAYRALLESWAKEGREEGAARAVEIIHDIESKVERGLVPEDVLDVRLYTAAMRAVLKSKVRNSHIIVESLYDRLVHAAEARPYKLALQPDTAAMTVVLQAWAGSIDPKKARTVWNKWQEMMSQFEQGNLRMRPSAVAAAAVLHACAYTTASKGKEVQLDAVDIALEAWQNIQEHHLVNEFLVKLLLRVLGRHVEEYDERVRLASIAFQHACVAGCVSTEVVDALHTYTPTLHKELPTDSNQKVALPSTWTRLVNVNRS